ncbi:PREDICTED: interleukin-27 subunit beta-like [Elephantulus edwardii]|uniref:interleukin-27 subunit beta-like n=1 Tax=Elephantulus edwardii TaxID=28737 RepID=UPI0003F08983|nr:PREDICTED: interleukin-27 subunit beta-like [Elephantulus edwardii]
MPTEFIATYRVGLDHSAETKTCIQPTPITPRCTMNEFVPLSHEHHLLNVTAIYPDGITTTLFPFVPEDIIKPDPPVIFRVSTVSENELEVQWFAPRSWPYPEDIPLKYQLRYKPCKSKDFRQGDPTEATTLRIKATLRKRTYCIQVNAQHHLGYGKPSEWSPTTVFPVTPFK